MKTKHLALSLSALISLSVPCFAAPGQDIVDTAVKAGAFKTLVTAVKAAGLVDALKSDGPFTVFAPTDEAFAKLPEGTVASLLKNPEKLAAILKYHVVAGRFMSSQVVKMSEATTLQGSPVALAVRDGQVFVDAASGWCRGPG